MLISETYEKKYTLWSVRFILKIQMIKHLNQYIYTIHNNNRIKEKNIISTDF
jgi:hypothetical protein